MVRRFSGWSTWCTLLAVVAGLTLAVPAAAQSTGQVKGTVTDDKGQPVEGATILIEQNGGTGRRFETKSDKKGTYIQIGIGGGSYKVWAEKEKLGSAPATVTVRMNQPQTVNLVLGVASAAATKESAAKLAELKKVFDEGVALSGAGKHQEAIDKFNAGIVISPNCYDCYNNVGFSYAQLKDWDKAEAAYKKSIEVKGDDPGAYNGLATVYNAQRKFDQAAEVSAKAAQFSGGAAAAGGGGNADATFNQAVIFWNAGKVAEAKAAFQQVIQMNPNHAEAHYQLGMALVNEGNLAGAAAEFASYLKIAPSGPNAATATATNWTKGMQEIATQTTDFSKKSFEATQGLFEKLIGAKTLDKAIEIQTEFAKQSYEGAVAQTTKLGELYAGLMKEAFKPVEQAFAKAQAPK